jgi:hypothetical protein
MGSHWQQASVSELGKRFLPNCRKQAITRFEGVLSVIEMLRQPSV